MTVTYPEDDVATVANPGVRQILTERGLPESDVLAFYPARRLASFERDPAYVHIGVWGSPGVPIGVHRTDGSVVAAAPWSSAIDRVNSSLGAFVDSIDAVDSAAPLSSPDDPRYAREAAARVRDVLERIDPPALADLTGFWDSIVEDIANGDYS